MSPVRINYQTSDGEVQSSVLLQLLRHIPIWDELSPTLPPVVLNCCWCTNPALHSHRTIPSKGEVLHSDCGNDEHRPLLGGTSHFGRHFLLSVPATGVSALLLSLATGGQQVCAFGQSWSVVHSRSLKTGCQRREWSERSIDYRCQDRWQIGIWGGDICAIDRIGLDSLFQQYPIITSKKRNHHLQKANSSAWRCIWRYSFQVGVWYCQILNQVVELQLFTSLWIPPL